MLQILVASVILHLAVILLAVVAGPMSKEKLDLEPTMIPIDIVEVGPMASPRQGQAKPEPPPSAPKPAAAQPTAAPPPPPPPPPQHTPEPPPPPPPPKPAPPPPEPALAPDLPKPHEKPQPPKPEPPKPEPPKPQPQPPKPEPPKPTPPKPPEKQKPAEKKPEKPPEKKPVETDPLASVLAHVADLAKKQPPAPASEPSTAKPSTTNGAAPQASEKLTGPELDALRGQISNNWAVDPGKAKAADMIVDVMVELNPDKTVRRAALSPKSLARAGSDPAYRTSAEAAIRAVMRSSPLKIPIEKLGGDLRVTITFNPKDMF